MFKTFEKSLPQNVDNLLFSISDPDYPLWEEKEKEMACKKSKVSFAEDANLIINCKNIKKITLNLTFLLSRWNILADLCYLVYTNQEIIQRINPHYEGEKEEIKNIFKKMGISEEFVNIFQETAIQLFKLRKDFEKKQITLMGAQKLLAEFAGNQSIQQAAENRGEQWEKDNKESINRLIKSGKLNKNSKLYWRQFLFNTQNLQDLVELFRNQGNKKIKQFLNDIKNKKEEDLQKSNAVFLLTEILKKDSRFFRIRQSQVGDRIKKRYPKAKGVIKSFISYCVESYLAEESLFIIWLRNNPKNEYEIETHDGKLTPTPKYALKLITEYLGKNPIPFNVIVDNEQNDLQKTGRPLSPSQVNSSAVNYCGKDFFNLLYEASQQGFFKSPSYNPEHPMFCTDWKNESVAHFVGRNGNWAWAFKIEKSAKQHEITTLIKHLRDHLNDLEGLGKCSTSIILAYAHVGNLTRMEYRIEVQQANKNRPVEKVQTDINSAINGCIKALTEWQSRQQNDDKKITIAV